MIYSISFLWFILMNAQMSTQLLKNSYKSMSCLGRIHQFPRNFLCWQAPGCIQKSVVLTLGKKRVGSQNLIKKVLLPEDMSTTLLFLRNLQMGPISQSIWPFPALGQCYKPFYGRNLRIFVISQSVYLWQVLPSQSNFLWLRP